MKNAKLEQNAHSLPRLDFKNLPYVRSVAGEVSAPTDGVEMMYSMSEGFFGTAGPRLVSLGWSVFPQERDGKRLSAQVDRTAIKWKPYQNRLPTVKEITKWAAQCPSHNVAIIMGFASGNTFAVDADIYDESLAWQVRELADQILGQTPLKRIGQVPKIVLIYRLAEGVTISRKALRFTDEKGAASEDMIEILYNGAITGYGRHHKTQKYFRWPENQPLFVGPEFAPLVTVAQVEEFLKACNRIRAFKNNSRLGGSNPPPGVAVDYYRLANVRVPHAYPGDWIVEDGVVVGGREAFLTSWTFSLCGPVENAEYLKTESGLRGLIEVAQTSAINCVRDDYKRSRRWINQQIDYKIRSAATKFSGPNSDYSHWAPMLDSPDGGYKRLVSTPISFEPVDALAWLGNGEVSSLDPKAKKIAHGPEVTIPGARADRALQTDRRGVTHRVHLATSTALASVFSDVALGMNRVHVLPTATGGSKSTRAMQEAIAFAKPNPRTAENGPILFLCPTHKNISESLAVARSAGAISPDDPEYYTDAKAVRILIYKGKIRAGCHYADKINALQELGIGTEGLCNSTRKDPWGKTVPVLCDRFDDCPYQKQLRDAAGADIIICVHNYFTLPVVPVAMQNPRLVIVDESVTFKLAHTKNLPFSSILIKRIPPTQSPKEKEVGFDPRILVSDRDDAVKLALRAGNAGDDAAAFFVKERAREKAEAGVEVCKRAMSVVRNVRPDMDPELLEEIMSGGGASGAEAMTDLHLEWRLWTIILARYDLLISDEINASLAEVSGQTYQKRALGDRDYFIQIRSETVGDKEIKSWRLAWRTKPNWAGQCPALLLDASADQEIVKVHYAGSEVVYHDIDADLNIHVVVIGDETYSKSSMLPREGDGEKVEAHNMRAARRVDRVRRFTSLVCGRNSDGRVLVSTSKDLREHMFKTWTFPKNLDDLHYGNQRGRDFAKGHRAALMIGRTEQTISVVDGYVAAMTADIAPEDPLDKLGTGFDAEGQPVRRKAEQRMLKFRQGTDVNKPTPQMPTPWGQRIEKQWREEEIMQALGRLRPVFREDTPTAFIASSVVPEGLIIDRMMTMDEALAADGAAILDGARMSGGLIDSDALAWDCDEFINANWDAPGFTKVAWTDATGAGHRSLFLSSWGDEYSALRDSVASMGFDESFIATVDISEPNSPIVESGRGEQDAISATYLIAEEHAAMEASWHTYCDENLQAVTDNYAVERLGFERLWLSERSVNA